MADPYAHLPPELHPANYEMKRNPVKPQLAAHPAEALSIDPTDVVAVRAMVWDKLVRIAAVAPPNAALLPILRELMDRIEGKPAQSVHLDATIKQVTVNATIKFADVPDMVIEQHNNGMLSSSD